MQFDLQLAREGRRLTVPFVRFGGHIRGVRGLVLGIAIVAAACGTGASPTASAPVARSATPPQDAGITDAANPTPPNPPARQIYYVRVDGGTAVQCDGRHDTPMSTTSTACAWAAPYLDRVDPGSLVRVAPGTYRVSRPLPQIPPGVIVNGDCNAPPTLLGVEGTSHVLDLSDTASVTVACFEITDAAGCVAGHSGGLACRPGDDFASDGIVATDSSSVTLRHLDVHGFSEVGIRAGRLHGVRVDDVRVAANGWAGWDGDVAGPDHNTGRLHFSQWIVEDNGCVEPYPVGRPHGCWAQSAGGYGDGVGTGETTGEWIIEDSVFRRNTSDGLDLLYVVAPGNVRIDRVVAEDNAGNQLKTRGPTKITNAVVAGTCGYFDGAPFAHDVDTCRAAGSAISLDLAPGEVASIVNSTIYSEGDCLIVTSGARCSGARVVSRNNVLIGGQDRLQPGDRSCAFYDDCGGVSFEQDHAVMFEAKGTCPMGTGDLCVDPKVVGLTPNGFDARLMDGSVAIDSGASGVDIPIVDIEGRARPAGGGVDRGAFER